MKRTLAERRVFLSGAAGGIGLACVERFVAEGATVGCFDVNTSALDALGKRFSTQQVKILPADITMAVDVTRAVDQFARDSGGLDGVVNTAGADLVRPLEGTSDEDWRGIMAINLDGPMHVCRAAFPHMRSSGGGSIVNVSSAAGLQPLIHRTAYSASKAALQMFSKALALEGAEFGIRVNCVCPGAVDTELLRGFLSAAADPAAELERMKSRYALRRIADPGEIAAAIFWLIGPESSYVTGAAIAVDGGRTFH